MKRRIETWKIERTYIERSSFSSPDFQRNPKLWSVDDKRLLIDSILQDIDIPKIYLNETKNGQYEIIDGQQRLWAIWEFLDNEYVYKTKDRAFPELEEKKYEGFLPAYKDKQDKIFQYDLQFVIITNASDEYLRKLFVRLQLGLLLVSGEKLKAEIGQIRNFIFEKMVEQPFIQALKIANKRYAKQTLCAQICINAFRRETLNVFSRTRYEDLYYFFREYKNITESNKDMYKTNCERIIVILGLLEYLFQNVIEDLRNRSFILSLYLFVEELYKQDGETEVRGLKEKLVSFIGMLLLRLKEESKRGLGRTNKELYEFESFLSNAPGEKYQIQKRHDKLFELYKYYSIRNKIKGD